ncbi:MAG: sulfatase [Pseudomonadota bacterium]
MRAIVCLFDSLNRAALGAYGGRAIPTPNFDRLAERAVVFDQHFVGSLPCMPARRDLHTGRLNFMHRSWGPLEPFDNSFPQILQDAGIYSHLVTDHNHYFEDGGATYHTRFASYDFIRGQENDAWKAMVQAPVARLREQWAEKHYSFASGRVDDPNRRRLIHVINKQAMQREDEMPGPRCFASAFEFLQANHREDGWFLQLECFDPHEPFDAPPSFKQKFSTGWNGGILNWPIYEQVTESAEEIAEIRANYAALVNMCDHYFGRLLDFMDQHDMWRDTALILTTDHGFLLSEHDWWGKNLQPYYREISHIPLMIHHPAYTAQAGSRIGAISQTFDLMPTILDIFDQPMPPEITGRSLLGLLADPTRKNRDVAIFGMFGGPLGASDGRYDCYLYPEDLYAPGLHEYTLMPVHIRSLMTADELNTAELTRQFSFTKGAPLMRIDALRDARRIPNVDDRVFENPGTQLYDLANDPNQGHPIAAPAVEARLRAGIVEVLEQHECPAEVYGRLGLNSPIQETVLRES